VLLVGLTGGIGSGKSTVAAMLAERGAVVFDADVLARQAIAPGTPGHDRVVERFGPVVLGPEEALDRSALAEIVFSDREARGDLEEIVHPEVFRLLAVGAERHRGTDAVVVFDAPLIIEAGQADLFDVLVLVTAPAEERIKRIVEARAGMSKDGVRQRITAQLPDEDKVRHADVVIDNPGSLDRLRARVDALWDDLAGRARAGA
jgi:dephospho-CoA kinase